MIKAPNQRALSVPNVMQMVSENVDCSDFCNMTFIEIFLKIFHVDGLKCDKYFHMLPYD